MGLITSGHAVRGLLRKLTAFFSMENKCPDVIVFVVGFGWLEFCLGLCVYTFCNFSLLQCLCLTFVSVLNGYFSFLKVFLRVGSFMTGFWEHLDASFRWLLATIVAEEKSAVNLIGFPGKWSIFLLLLLKWLPFLFGCLKFYYFTII